MTVMMDSEKSGSSSNGVIRKNAIFTVMMVLCSVCLLLIFAKIPFKSGSNWTTNKHMINNVHDIVNIDYLQSLNLEEIDNLTNLLQDIKLTKRDVDIEKDDQPDSPSSSTSSSSSSSPLNEPGVRFAIVLSFLVFLNMVAICIHHLYMKISNPAASYRTVEQNISPF